jgi:hypothetical protein
MTEVNRRPLILSATPDLSAAALRPAPAPRATARPAEAPPHAAAAWARTRLDRFERSDAPFATGAPRLAQLGGDRALAVAGIAPETTAPVLGDALRVRTRASFGPELTSPGLQVVAEGGLPLSPGGAQRLSCEARTDLGARGPTGGGARVSLHAGQLEVPVSVETDERGRLRTARAAAAVRLGPGLDLEVRGDTTPTGRPRAVGATVGVGEAERERLSLTVERHLHERTTRVEARVDLPLAPGLSATAGGAHDTGARATSGRVGLTARW